MEIQTGIPNESGVYVCYIDLEFKSRFMEKKLFFFHKESQDWMYLGSDQRFRGVVNCWIGPLPSPTKDDLETSIDVRYAISTKEKAKLGSFKNGPYEFLTQATEQIGDKDDYIFKLVESDCECIRKWSVNKLGWVRRKKKKKTVT